MKTESDAPCLGPNPLGLDGIEFVEFVSPDPRHLDSLFRDFGFALKKRHIQLKLDYYNQNDIHFLVNSQPGSFASRFGSLHGPSISSMGWRVQDAAQAFRQALARGARPAFESDLKKRDGTAVPAIYGIGDSLIYFVDGYSDWNPGDPKNRQDHLYDELGFKDVEPSGEE